MNDDFLHENPADLHPAPDKLTLRWIDPLTSSEVALYGSSVAKEEGAYVRLSQAERESFGKDSALAWLSTNPAGLQLKFETDSKDIVVDVTLAGKANMWHMTAAGQCGFDLYVYDEKRQEYLYHNSSDYDESLTHYTSQLLAFPYREKGKMRKYLLNFPLYMSLLSFRLGVSPEAVVRPVAFAHPKPIILYGTSIAQGGVVSRPGMLYTNILSRKFDREFLNYGFSGAGLAEPAMGQILGERTGSALFVIDCEANAGCDEKMRDRLPDFIDAFRQKNPDVPILLMNRIRFAMDYYNPKRRAMALYYKRWLKALAASYQKQGVAMSFLDASHFFPGNGSEVTTDGVHPSDLGHYFIAQGMEKACAQALKD